MLLKLGSVGPEVLSLQEKLGIDADGIFGPQTLASVLSFQHAHGLLSDGIVGPQTLGAFSTKPPVTVPQAARIKGIDMYSLDLVNSWPRLKAAGIEFCSIKVNQGVGSNGKGRPQSRYAEYRQKAQAVGMLTGPYSFAMFDENIKTQANLFCDLVESQGGLNRGDLLPLWDWEFDPESRGVKRGDGQKSLEFLRIVEERLKRRSFIYSGFYTIMETLQYEPDIKKDLLKYPLWLAQYTSEKNLKIPAPWNKWTTWQMREAVIDGAANPLDLDVFDGSREDLIKLCDDNTL